MNKPPEMQSARPVSKRRRWWFYALAAGAGLALMVVAVLVALLLYARSMLVEYTSSQPKPVTRITITKDDVDSLVFRWQRFHDEVNLGRSPPPFVMSSKDLNAFISMIPRFSGRVYLDLEGDRLRADFTLPLRQAIRGAPGGRHVNGSAWLKMTLGEDQFPKLEIESLKLNGKSPPGWIESGDYGHLLNGVLRVLEDERFLAQLQDIEIREGKLIFTPATSP